VHPEFPSSGICRYEQPRQASNEGSEAIAERLDKVVGQLNIITKTLQVLEQRMRVTEEQVSQLAEKSQVQPIGEQHEELPQMEERAHLLDPPNPIPEEPKSDS